MNTNLELSVVIPAYNEGKIVRRNLDTVDDYLRTLGFEYEIVFVNDGSSDDTLKQVTEMQSKRLCIISYADNKGKGFAVNRGMMAARGRYRLFMDMDLSTDLTEIPKFLQYLRDGICDICVGNRHSVGVLAQKRPWYRALFGKIFAHLSSITSGCRLDDFTCGFKIFTMDACEKIFPQQSIYNWAFDTELMSIAHQSGLRVRQMPVEWQQHSHDSKVRIGPAMLSSCMSLMKIWYSKGCVNKNRKGIFDGDN